MKNENPIDKLFRDGLQQREYAFEPAYWEAAEQLILSQQNRKKRRLLYIFSYVLALLTVITIPLLVLNLSALPDEEQRVWVMPETHAKFAHPNAALTPLVPFDRGSQTLSAQDSPQQRVTNNRNNRTFISANSGSLTETSTQESEYPSLQSASLVETDEEMGVTPKDPVRQAAYEAMIQSLETWPPGFGNCLNLLFEEGELRHPKRVPLVPKRHRLNLRIGADLSPNWEQTELQTQRLNTHPSVSLRYTYLLTPRLSLYTGLGYQGRGGLGTDTLISRREFGFGVSGETIEITQQRLHQISVPIGVEVRLRSRHHLMLGLSANYLLNSSSQQTRTTFASLGEPDQQTRSVWGYTNGFRQWDTQLQVGYAFYVNKGLRTGILANYGLNDLTRDDFYGQSQRNRNTQIRWFVDLYLSHF